jgi:N-acyl-D-aspartate/D-glutamate deacylase
VIDLLLRGGVVHDGTGAPPRQADVAVVGREIAAVGPDLPVRAARVIDAEGRAVCPGFVDLHSHSDLVFPLEPRRRLELLEGRIRQGITTEVVGNCGLGAFPLAAANRAIVERLDGFLAPDGAWPAPWATAEEYLARLEASRVPINVATLAAHGPLRTAAMGMTDRPPTPDEAAHMERELRAALRAGAFGLSFGLIYPPGVFAGFDEVARLCEVVREEGGFAAFHQRSGSPELVRRAVDEVLEAGRASGASVHLSHDHVQGEAAYPMIEGLLARGEAARAQGIDFTADVIPYTGVCTTFLALYPPWALAGGVAGFLALARDPDARRRMRREMETAVPEWPEGGRGWSTNIVRDVGWRNVFVAHVERERNRAAVGLSLEELGARAGADPFDALTDLLCDDGALATMQLFGISGDRADDAPLRRFLAHPGRSIVTDAWEIGKGRPHPGAYGAFPRVLARYVRETGLLTMEAAVHKMTGQPAARLGLADRGVVRAGAAADLLLVDPARVADAATWEEPRRFAVGIDAVIVNGTVVWDGRSLADGAGQVLRAGRGGSGGPASAPPPAAPRPGRS